MVTETDRAAARELMTAVLTLNEKIDAMSALNIEVSFIKESSVGKHNKNWWVAEMIRTNVERITPYTTWQSKK